MIKICDDIFTVHILIFCNANSNADTTDYIGEQFNDYLMIERHLTSEFGIQFDKDSSWKLVKNDYVWN